jgi:hypothetical protein
MMRCRTALLLVFLLLQLPTARAAQLDKAACDKLKTEQAELEQGGVRAAMANGPQWAKANLKPEQLEQIRRMLDVEGQLLFRCNGRPLVALPKDVEADPALSDAGEPMKDSGQEGAARAKAAPGNVPANAPGNTKAAAGPKAPLKKAATAKPPPGDANGARTAAAQTAKARQKQKGKARADDAYKPPPSSDPTADPFASQRQSEQH